MTKMIIRGAAPLLFWLMLAACGDASPTVAPTTPTVATIAPTSTIAPTTIPATTTVATTSPAATATTAAPTRPPSPDPTSTTNPDAPAAKARKAVEDEVQRSQNIAASDLQFVLTEKQDWPDSALGCPKPGELYSQIVTPGYRVVVLVKSQNMRYEYHTDLRGRAVSCKA